MAIRPVDFYLASKDEPSFYIFIYDKPKPPEGIKPDQILKADTWKEATQFASCFVSQTDKQFCKVSALGLLLKKGLSWETAANYYWNEEGQVMYTEWKMPAESVKFLSGKDMQWPKVET